MKLVGIEGRGRTALEIADIGSLFRDDQRPLELPRLFFIDPKISGYSIGERTPLGT